MAFTITPAGGGGITFNDVVASFDAIAGNYWDVVDPDGPFYENQKIGTPGVDGVAIGRDGFRSRHITAECYVIGGTRAACMNVLTTLDGCFNSACSVAVPNGATYAQCEMLPYRIIEQPTDTGYGTFLMKIALEIEVERLA